jgi:hypothetical protein
MRVPGISLDGPFSGSEACNNGYVNHGFSGRRGSSRTVQAAILPPIEDQGRIDRLAMEAPATSRALKLPTTLVIRQSCQAISLDTRN